MIVFHGTGRYNLESFLEASPKTYSRDYLRGREAFSTSRDFEVAALFALRRSPPSVLRGDEREMGIVLEYELDGSSREGKDWVPAVCPGVLQDEQEIAVLNPKVLKLLAVWYLEQGEWARRPIEAQKSQKKSKKKK